MNKTIAVLASLAVMGSAADCMAAASAVVNYNNYDNNSPLLYQATTGGATVNATAATTYVELLAGPVGGALSPVTVGSSGTSATVLGLTEDGFFDYGNAVIAGVTAGADAQFQLLVWTGGSTWETATYQNSKVTWTQATGSWDLGSSPPGTPSSVALNVPASALTMSPAVVPEPSTIALGLLGAAALFIRRRK